MAVAFMLVVLGDLAGEAGVFGLGRDIFGSIKLLRRLTGMELG